MAQLQTYSKGTVDHSVNVSVLSVYLAMQMGYSHALILSMSGWGASSMTSVNHAFRSKKEDTQEVIERKMKDHPTLGIKLLESQQKVPNEVKMIVAQHHECHDGSGFPKKLRGERDLRSRSNCLYRQRF